MHELGIDRSYSVLDDTEGMNYAESLQNITEEMILGELEGYRDSDVEKFIELHR